MHWLHPGYGRIGPDGVQSVSDRLAANGEVVVPREYHLRVVLGAVYAYEVAYVVIVSERD